MNAESMTILLGVMESFIERLEEKTLSMTHSEEKDYKKKIIRDHRLALVEIMELMIKDGGRGIESNLEKHRGILHWEDQTIKLNKILDQRRIEHEDYSFLNWEFLTEIMLLDGTLIDRGIFTELEKFKRAKLMKRFNLKEWEE